MAAAKQLNKLSADRPTHSISHKRSTNELAARHILHPYQQGDLDCQCGLYSIINAIRLMRQPISPISTRGSRSLFETGIDYLARKGALNAAILNGIGIRRWKKLAILLAADACTEMMTIIVERPPNHLKHSERAIVSWIDSGLSIGSPILLHLGRRRQHYTVITASDDQYFHLFDSSGSVRIKRIGCVTRFELTPSVLFRLKVQMPL